jgi:hypothetical protein
MPETMLQVLSKSIASDMKAKFVATGLKPAELQSKALLFLKE